MPDYYYMCPIIKEKIIKLITKKELKRLKRKYINYIGEDADEILDENASYELTEMPFNEDRLLYYVCGFYKGPNIIEVVDILKSFTNFESYGYKYENDYNYKSALVIAIENIKDHNTLIEITKRLRHSDNVKHCWSNSTSLMFAYKLNKEHETLIEITKLLLYTAYLKNRNGCETALMVANKYIKKSYTLIEITKLLIYTKYISYNIICNATNFNLIHLIKDSHLFDYTYTI